MGVTLGVVPAVSVAAFCRMGVVMTALAVAVVTCVVAFHHAHHLTLAGGSHLTTTANIHADRVAERVLVS